MYAGSSSIARAIRASFSHAMIVVPEPEKGSYTACPGLELLTIGRRMHSTGFCVL